jgi:uncharacterized membrane protein
MKLNESNQSFTFYLLPFAFLLFTFIRLWHLTDSCLWFDEIFSIHAATNSFSNFFGFIAQDLIHPPLFYLLLKFWISLGSESLFWVRFFAVFCSIASILQFILLCRELKFTSNQIFIAFFAFAINGSLIKYAQEVRMYSLLVLLSLCSMWLFVRWLNVEKASFIALLAINLLLIYTHYFGWLIVITELCVVIWRRKKIKQFVSQTAILSGLFLPWAYLVFNAWRENQGLTQNIGWQTKPDLWQFFSAIHQPVYFPSSNLETSAVLISAPILLICLGLVIYFTIKNYRDERFQIISAFVVIPFLIAFIASRVLPISVWGIRHLTVIFIPYFLLVALSISTFDWKKIVIPILLFFIIIGGLAEFTRPKQVYIWCAWENLADKIEPDAKIYAFEDLVAYQLWFANKQFEITKINGYDDMSEDKAFFLPRGFDSVKVADKSAVEGEHFWLAFRQNKLTVDKQVVRDLEQKGYQIGEPVVFQTQGLTAFMLPVQTKK